MVLPVSDGVTRVPPYSGSWAEEKLFRLRGCHPLWPTFPSRLATVFLVNSNVQSYNPKKQASWFGLFPVRSPLLGESKFLYFPAGTEMFQFPAFILD